MCCQAGAARIHTGLEGEASVTSACALLELPKLPYRLELLSYECLLSHKNAGRGANRASVPEECLLFNHSTTDDLQAHIACAVALAATPCTIAQAEATRYSIDLERCHGRRNRMRPWGASCVRQSIGTTPPSSPLDLDQCCVAHRRPHALDGEERVPSCQRTAIQHFKRSFI